MSQQEEKVIFSKLEYKAFALKILDIFVVRVAISFLIAAEFLMATKVGWEFHLLLKWSEIVFVLLFTTYAYNIITQVFLQCMRRKPEKANSMCRFFCAYTAMLLLPFTIAGIFLRKYLINLPDIAIIYAAAILIACMVIDFLIYKYAENLYKKNFDDPIGLKSIPKAD